jgi:hypothetical protein
MSIFNEFLKSYTLKVAKEMVSVQPIDVDIRSLFGYWGWSEEVRQEYDQLKFEDYLEECLDV